MATEIILVTPIEIVKRTPMNGNVDVDKFAFMIPDQQRYILEPILGTALLNRLLVDVLAGTLAGVYLGLVNTYCKPILINSVFAEFINFADVAIDNNGTFNVLPADSQRVDEKKIVRQVKTYREKAQAYISRLEHYLCSSGSQIPEYRDAQLNSYDIKPKRRSDITGGWYLKTTKRKPWYLEDVN